MHEVKHSTGLVVADAEPGVADTSFVVRHDGELVELYGWSHADRVPEVFPNSPPNNRTVLTVAVEGDSNKVLRTLAKLVAEHQERFGTCMMWVASRSNHVRNWAAGGCQAPKRGRKREPEPEPEPEPEVEKMGAGEEKRAKVENPNPKLQAEVEGIPGVSKPATKSAKPTKRSPRAS